VPRRSTLFLWAPKRPSPALHSNTSQQHVWLAIFSPLKLRFSLVDLAGGWVASVHRRYLLSLPCQLGLFRVVAHACTRRPRA